MYNIDDSFLESVGLGGLPADQKSGFLQYAQDQLEIRIGEKMSNNLNEAQLDEFEKIIDNDEETVGALLQNAGNYQEDPLYIQIKKNTNAPEGSITLLNDYITAKWLDMNCPNYDAIINEALDELRNEIVTQKDAILAAA
jgi:hypothetical protein